MVTNPERGHARADLTHDAGAFMAEDCRELAFRIETGKRVGIGMADPRRHDFDEDFAGLGAADLDRFDGQRFVGRPGDRSA